MENIEHIVELKGLSPELVGRIVIVDNSGMYNVEVDIIQSESGKIYNHVAMIYNEDDKNDALNIGVHHLTKFLQQKSKS